MSTFRQENISGASLTGSNGATSRQYTLQYSTLLSGSTLILQQGGYLYENTDYTISGQTITFSVAVFNADLINIYYHVQSSSASSLPSGTLKYATTLQLASMLNIIGKVPSRGTDPGEPPAVEVLGQGDGTAKTFYFDYANIIDGTYTLYKGSSTGTNLVALTETTDYIINIDDGSIVLTGAGSTNVSTNYVCAKYWHYKVDMTDSQFEETLLRAQQEVDDLVNTTFTDGTATNPSWPSRTELHSSQGLFNRTYFLDKRPLRDISTTLNGSLSASATVAVLTDGGEFPTTGSVVVGSEIISYTGISTNTLTGLTRGVDDSDAAAHSSGDEVHSTVIEVSSTVEGSEPTWTVAQHGSEVSIDEDGHFHIYNSSLLDLDVLSSSVHPRQDIPDRVRVRYLWGEDTIPTSITRLTLLLAKRQLIQDNIGSSMFQGKNEFRPEMFNVDQKEIDSITGAYRLLPMGNT